MLLYFAREVYLLNFSKKIKDLRIAKGLTQKQLADSLNVSQNAVYNWENKKREPSLDMIKKIAKVFDFPLYLLLDDNFELENVELEMKRARPVNSYEMAIEKAIHHEELTEETEQIIIGIPGKLRQKGDTPLLYENSHSFASSEEELNKLQKEHSIEPNKRQNDKIHKYDAVVEITPEAIEKLKENAEAREILKKYESGEKILESDYKMIIEYYIRMMEYSKLFQYWLAWYKHTCEPLNDEGRKKVAEYAETLAETDKYTKPEEWFKGRPAKEEIDKAVTAYPNGDNPDEPLQE